jgi:hypothetical protein
MGSGFMVRSRRSAEAGSVPRSGFVAVAGFRLSGPRGPGGSSAPSVLRCGSSDGRTTQGFCIGSRRWRCNRRGRDARWPRGASLGIVRCRVPPLGEGIATGGTYYRDSEPYDAQRHSALMGSAVRTVPGAYPPLPASPSRNPSSSSGGVLVILTKRRGLDGLSIPIRVASQVGPEGRVWLADGS